MLKGYSTVSKANMNRDHYQYAHVQSQDSIHASSNIVTFTDLGYQSLTLDYFHASDVQPHHIFVYSSMLLSTRPPGALFNV